MIPPLSVGSSTRYRVDPAVPPLVIGGTAQPVSQSLTLGGAAAESSHELFTTPGVDVALNDQIESDGGLYQVKLVNQYKGFLPHSHIFLSFLKGVE